MSRGEEPASNACHQNKKCGNGACSSCMFCCFLVGNYIKPREFSLTSLLHAKQTFHISAEKFLANYNSDTWRPPEVV